MSLIFTDLRICHKTAGWKVLMNYRGKLPTEVSGFPLSGFFTSKWFSSVFQSSPTLCDPMYCSTPGLPVHHQLPELTQTHVHQVFDAIQPSHPLSSPSPAFALSQHQGLSQWVSSLHQVAKCWSFSSSISPSNEYSRLNIPLGWTDWISLQSKRLSRVLGGAFTYIIF